MIRCVMLALAACGFVLVFLPSSLFLQPGDLVLDGTQVLFTRTVTPISAQVVPCESAECAEGEAGLRIGGVWAEWYTEIAVIQRPGVPPRLRDDCTMSGVSFYGSARTSAAYNILAGDAEERLGRCLAAGPPVSLYNEWRVIPLHGWPILGAIRLRPVTMMTIVEM